VHQGYIEPQTAVARPEAGGGLHVETATQASFYTREQVARLYELPLGSIRVTAAPLGGAFGAKFFLIEPLVAGAALALRRPVRLSFTRSEDMANGQPAPASVIELEIGGRRSGELVAIRSRILLDSGAFSDWSMQDLAAGLVAGPYRWETWAIDGYGVYTNRTPAGAYRGPCGPQTAFAVESLVDELAAKLGVDPLDVRERSGAREGDPRVDGTRYGLLAVGEVMDAVRQHPLWQRRGELPPDEGVGVAAGIWIGATMSSSAVCRMEGDGGLTVITGAVDMTGISTGFAAIAAETFGVPIEDVRVVVADTESAPWAPPSGGSVMTFSMGKAVERAAEAAKERLLDLASQELEIAPSDLEVVDGEVRAVGSPDTKVEVKKLARKVSGFFAGHVPVEGHGSNAPPGPSPSVSAHLAHVKVDRETGEVKLLGYVVAQDCGRALNPALVEGQMRGGAAQGIGWALLEELVVDDAGQLVTGSLMSYALPHAEHVPPIDTLLVEVPSVDGPYGAKGIGEAGVIPATGAIANAIAAAVGVRLRELPMTPPRVWRALSSA
jgi:CO/xanthine dehydrogenase Mo-binding subunit